LIPASEEVDSIQDLSAIPPEPISTKVIEAAISQVASRCNYGIDEGPASLSVWRWEVFDISLIQDAVSNKDAPAKRLAERVQVL